jgi:hypothetical protein
MTTLLVATTDNIVTRKHDQTAIGPATQGDRTSVVRAYGATNYPLRRLLGILSTLCIVILASCDSTGALMTISSTLDKLLDNKSLSEQFVRDIKATIDSSDPLYQHLMTEYEDSRDAYNRVLDSVETAALVNHPSASEDVEEEAVQRSADFFADATRSLRPEIDARRIAFDKVISLPRGLSSSLSKIPNRNRATLLTQMDKQVRWRSWSKL